MEATKVSEARRVGAPLHGVAAAERTRCMPDLLCYLLLLTSTISLHGEAQCLVEEAMSLSLVRQNEELKGELKDAWHGNSSTTKGPLSPVPSPCSWFVVSVLLSAEDFWCTFRVRYDDMYSERESSPPASQSIVVGPFLWRLSQRHKHTYDSLVNSWPLCMFALGAPHRLSPRSPRPGCLPW